jgi:hypothetical protein
VKEMKKKPNPKMEEQPMDFLDSFNIEAPIEEPAVNNTYKVKVTHPSLRIRRAPNLQAEVVDTIRDQGYYTILDEVNGWGKIGDDKWIMLSYTEIVAQ